MRVVGEAVQERARASGDGFDYFLACDDRTQWSVSAGETFGGDQDVGRDTPVIDREVASGAAHPRHDLVRD